jgi:GNAT superfamily N-acetyltransferase
MADLVRADGQFLEQILDATYDIWNGGLGRNQYRRFWDAQTRTPWGATQLTWWALVDRGEVLASAKEYVLQGVLDGRPVRVAGIGAVFTQPGHRGHGYAHALVEQLIARAARAGADLALLFSEIGAEFYARLGFTAIPTCDLDITVAQSERHGAPATMVRVGDDRDLDAIVTMNGLRAAPFRFHLERDRGLVTYAMTKKRLFAGLSPAGAREMQFFVAEEGTVGVAYVVLSVAAGVGPGSDPGPTLTAAVPAVAAVGPISTAAGAAGVGPRSDPGPTPTAGEYVWTIEECGDRDPTGARVGAILQVLLARDPAAPRPTIRGWLPPGFVPPQITLAATQPSAEVMMVRPLTPAADAARTLGADGVLYWRADLF